MFFEIGIKVLNTRNQLTQGLIINRTMLEPVIDATYEAGLDLCRRSDVLIRHFILHSARAAADTIGIPQISVTFAHMLTPSRYIHPHGLPNLGQWANTIEWEIAAFALNRTMLKDLNVFRSRVGLINTHADADQTLLGILLVKLDELGERRHTGRTPRRPNVDQNHLPFVLFHGRFDIVDISGCHIYRDRAWRIRCGVGGLGFTTDQSHK